MIQRRTIYSRLIAGTQLLAAAAVLLAPAIGWSESTVADSATAPAVQDGALRNQELSVKAAAIDDLLAGNLALEIDPQSLFDIPVNDASAVAIEAARLELLLRDQDAKSGAGTSSQVRKNKIAAALEEVLASAHVDAASWEMRRKLDQARLRFYEQAPEQRAALLSAHARRQADDAQGRALKEAEEAQQRARESEARSQQALAAAQSARTEAERLVGEERARLLGIAATIAAQQADLVQVRSDLASRAEKSLTFHRRVRQTIAASGGNAVAADALYLELRGWLRMSREELARSLAEEHFAPIAVRGGDNDPFENLPPQVDRREVDKLLADTMASAALLAGKTAETHRDQTMQLYEEVKSLNDDRLLLLPHLSGERRKALTGFGSAGLDQALAEMRQVGLVLRYHAASIAGWLRGDPAVGTEIRPIAIAVSSVVKMLLALAVFYWWRRIVTSSLSQWRARVQDNARRARTLDVGRLDAVIGLLLRTLKPVSWLLLLLVIAWILPPAVTKLMEVQLAGAILKWSLGGWLTVAVLDYLAKLRASRLAFSHRVSTDAIRLRSLRLLGFVVVAVGLILSMSRRIVGAGTIYSWVLHTCWWAAVPIGLVLVRWWREAIFERIGLARRKNRFEKWVLANPSGWRSLPAAALAGIYLFVRGAVAVLKNWLSGFDITRRFLAYIFRQQLDRLAEREAHKPPAPIPAEMRASLSPATPSAEIIHRDDDPKVAETIKHIDNAGGSVFAVVGERGAGRSTVLHRVRDRCREVFMVDCPFGGIEMLTAELAQAVKAAQASGLDELAAQIDSGSGDVTVVIDNAHRLIHPVMGGLAAFDQLIECARQHSRRCNWVISMDWIVWQFFGRARPVELLFDEVVILDEWAEQDIAALLAARTRQAGVEPSFDDLLPELPLDADEFERNEARASAAASYYRLIWDYASGNPSVALHTWCNSLGVAADGRLVVAPFRAPDGSAFDQLPDSAVFVLRAVIQLERARVDDIAAATLVPVPQVLSTLRHALKNGYLESVRGRYAVTWDWYRPMTRFLQRRHLLASE